MLYSCRRIIVLRLVLAERTRVWDRGREAEGPRNAGRVTRPIPIGQTSRVGLSLSSPCSSSPASLLSRYHPSSTSPAPRPPDPTISSLSTHPPSTSHTAPTPPPSAPPHPLHPTLIAPAPRATLSHTSPLVYPFCCLSLLREPR
ncbi:hypothetical protein L227DRAFT_234352 [Lentinus tigrinus ALCF2SS1-6]|uniref:Uncharacterized protein n=1 Tax=Lentinus tigrinus ALCF2SS1-6 TaxID=1328759 RepID=A0A5C2S1D9_9APHY|nr:hypothetical protein L227DRAFT_234352 [Lentinus tigrinus ALCF2SS1-6]